MNAKQQNEPPTDYFQLKIQAIENGFVLMLPGRTMMMQNGQPIQEPPKTTYAGTTYEDVCNALKGVWPKTISG